MRFAFPHTGVAPITAARAIVPHGRGRDAAAPVRRLAEAAACVLALALAWPVMALIAVCVRLDSAGPAIYRQERLGLHGRPFTILKFRTMRTDAEADGPKWADAHDRRVTRLGRFLRLTHLDELPQLFNVLGGSMSLIGPRPERPCFAAQIATAVPNFAARTAVRPGITGWAQVRYPYGATVEDARQKLALDLYYIRHRCLLLDLRILLATARVVVRREGAR